MNEITCRSCGQSLQGRFCHHCGERTLVASDRSLWHFIRTSILALAEADSGIRRTFSSLIVKPGLLSERYCTGQRVNYLKPIQVFLLANICYFLIQPLTDYQGYNTPLQSQLALQPYSSWLPLTELVEQRIEQRGVAFEHYETAFNAKSEVLAKALVFVMLPLFTALLTVTFFHRRPVLDHLVFAVHYFAFELLAVGCIFFPAWPYVLGAIEPLLFVLGPEPRLYITYVLREFGSLLVVLPYLFLATRRFYRLGNARALISTLALTFGLLVTLFCYRLVLFGATYFAT